MSCSHRRRTQSLKRTLCHFAQHHHALRIRERRPFSACFCLLLCIAVGKSIYHHHRGALERAIGETSSSRFCVRIQFRIYLSESSHIIIVMNALFAEPGDPRNALEHIEERLSHGRTTCCQWCEKKRDGRLSRRRRRVFVGVFLSFP